MIERKGNWFQTYTGKKFYLLDPQVDDISIIDIAHALSNKCRGGGHTTFFYSVAQHSINIVKYLKQQNAEAKILLAALLHDASEAYVPDVPSPFKPLIRGFKEIENRVQEVIWDAFNLEIYEEEYAIIKRADKLLLQHEANYNMDNCLWSDKDVQLNGIDISYCPIWAIKDEFLDLFHTLNDLHKKEQLQMGASLNI